jgi:hypothetical protein
MKTIYKIDPLKDDRWVAFLERHPDASIFHSRAWLEALRRTYGYQSVVLTTCAPGDELTNGTVFCKVESWLTGRRLVSLPFSDHCEPLGSKEDLETISASLKSGYGTEGMRYVEWRPLTPQQGSPATQGGQSFCFHDLDIRPSQDELFRSFHKDCVQRKIRRAEREALTYEDGRSDTLLAQFFGLTVQTRKRQLLPPQPIAWFQNLIACAGDDLKIRVASKDGEPVASILTLRYKNSLVYKYGCSNKSSSNLGGMHLLFWKAIQEAKKMGLEHFDLGRSDWDNPGLLDFKDRWGAKRSTLTYFRYPEVASKSAADAGWKVKIAKQTFARLPDSWLIPAGRLLYRHIG